MNELNIRDEIIASSMTTKDVAKALNVSPRTIRRIANKVLDPRTVLTRGVNGGESMLFNEGQVTTIKMELQKHHNVPAKETIASVHTELEMKQKAAEVIQWYMTSFENEKKIRKEVEQERDRLQIRLDESQEWYSIKRMEKLNRGRHFNWRLLKRESERMGVEIHEVFDANYGKVNAYHISVWESLFYDTLNYGD